MAIQCLHKTITTAAMRQLQFVDAASNLAADANAAVDDKQGNDAVETNLHAMCGFAWSVDPFLNKPAMHLQSERECRQAVAALLSDKKKQILEHALAGRAKLAVRSLGEALHTIQDRAFHNFEPWPFKGIDDAFLSNANYMICHALRDLGLISNLSLSDLPEGQFDVEITRRVGRQSYLSLRIFNNPLQSDRYPAPLGTDPREGEALLGTGGMVLFTFGAPPGSIKPRDPIVENRPRSTGESPHWSIATDGPAARARAEDATVEFINESKKELEGTPNGAARWDDLLNLRETAEPAPRVRASGA